MGHQHKCHKNWTHGCFPKPPCPLPTPQPTKDKHNIIYLVDEHRIQGRSVQAKRTDTPIRRYAWHFPVANLDTLNYGETPDTIWLHEKIANPQVNPHFHWEGHMYDLPGGETTLRVAIFAGAADASNDALSGVVGTSKIDRVVGMAASYWDNTVPIGQVVQVRRDDSYRCLGTDQGKTVGWHCAYYITKDTPRQTTGNFTGRLYGTEDADRSGLDAVPTDDPENDKAYDVMLDSNVAEDAPAFEGGPVWGGNIMPVLADDVPKTTEAELDKIFVVYNDDARLQLLSDTTLEIPAGDDTPDPNAVASGGQVDTSQAQSGQPDNTQPQSGQADNTQPQSGQPDNTQPQSGQADNTQPQSGQGNDAQPQSG